VVLQVTISTKIGGGGVCDGGGGGVLPLGGLSLGCSA